jgi:hypothetical protein
MKVYGTIMEKLKFDSFINLEVLDISSMALIQQLNQWNILNEIGGKYMEKVPDTELLKINSLANLQILKFNLKNEWFGFARVKSNYSFLNFLPSGVTTLVVVGLSKSESCSVNNFELNFSNVSSSVNKFEKFNSKMK